jgi:hypothetical protein
MTDATTPQGRTAIAKRFGVDEEWGNVKSKATPDEQYYQFLYLVKTKSTKDTLWISFIEGLHRHAAMVMSLLCSSFDLENNYINPGLLSMKDFKRAIIQHFQMNEHTPSEQLNNIMERDLLEPMMTSTFTVQAHVPKETNQTNIDKLMKTLIQHSSWISINRKESARKTISRLLSDGLSELIEMGTQERVNKRTYWIESGYTYLVQKGDSVNEFEKKMRGLNNNDESYGYSKCTKGDTWNLFITNPFNKEATEKYLDHISPNVMTKKNTIRPPFKIFVESMTGNVGRFDPFGNKEFKRRYIDSRHYKMSVIMPKMVYLLSSTLMKAALHK